MGIGRLWIPRPIEFDLEVDAPPEDVVRVLSESVRPRRLFAWTWSGPPLIGTVSDSGFHVRRSIVGRNSFVPRVSGTMEGTADGRTIVRVDVRLHEFVTIFAIIWFAFFAQFALAGTYVLVTEGQPWFLAACGFIGTFGFFLLRWGYVTVFPREAADAKRILREVFESLGVVEIEVQAP